MLERWRLISGALMFVLGAYALFAIYLTFRQVSHQQDLFDRFSNTSQENIGELLAEARELSPRITGERGGLLLFYLLLQDAWYHPEHSFDNLRELLETGPGLYWQHEDARAELGPQLAYAYYYAGLPSLVADWNRQVLIDSPHVRPQAKFLEVAALLALDREDLARLLVEDELTATGGSERTRLFAFQSWVALEDFERAESLGVNRGQTTQLDSNQRWAWATYLLHRRDFGEAHKQFNLLNIKPDEFPEYCFDEALALAATAGLEDERVEKLLVRASESHRAPRSVAGQQALICATLMETGHDDAWAARLAPLAEQHSADFWVVAAVCQARLAWQRGGGLFATKHHSLLAAGSVDAGLRCLELASTEYELQWANLLLARACSQEALADGEPPAAAGQQVDGTGDATNPPQSGLLEQAVVYLRQALGDPDSPAPVASQRLPDYDYFLLDESVKQARELHPWFDDAVHDSVLNFLRRRASEFEKVISGVDLSVY